MDYEGGVYRGKCETKNDRELVWFLIDVGQLKIFRCWYDLFLSNISHITNNMYALAKTYYTLRDGREMRWYMVFKVLYQLKKCDARELYWNHKIVMICSFGWVKHQNRKRLEKVHHTCSFGVHAQHMMHPTSPFTYGTHARWVLGGALARPHNSQAKCLWFHDAFECCILFSVLCEVILAYYFLASLLA
jgi:hypothetical protein